MKKIRNSEELEEAKKSLKIKKKPYKEPKLIVHQTLDKITLFSAQSNVSGGTFFPS